MYNEDVYTSITIAPKFVQPIVQDSKLKSLTIIPKVSWLSYSSLFHLARSLKASSFCPTNGGLLPLPTVAPTHHHCGELGNLIPYYDKLTPYPSIKVNMIASSSSSPICTTPKSQGAQFSNYTLHFCYIGTINHLIR